MAPFSIPQVPQELIAPFYKSPCRSLSERLFIDYSSWLLDHKPESNIVGMSLLIEDLIYLYKEQIDLQNDNLIRHGLTDEEITLFKRIGIDQLFSQLFAKNDRDIRRNLDHYFNLRGYTTVDLAIRSVSFRYVKNMPEIFTKLQLTPDMRHIFATYDDQISNSLSITFTDPTKQVTSVLSANTEAVSRIAEFLVEIANTHGEVRIYGFKPGKNGYLRYGTEYHPELGEIDSNMPSNDQRYYDLDPDHLNNFDFHLFLGALLADHQTFIIRKVGMEKNEVLFAFSLLDFDLLLETITSTTEMGVARPGFRSLGGLFTSDISDYHELSEQWFNIQRFMWMSNIMNGFSRVPATIGDWRDICRSSGVQLHLGV